MNGSDVGSGLRHFHEQLADLRKKLLDMSEHAEHLVDQSITSLLERDRALAETVIEAMRLGLDHGAPDVLERYQRWRRFDTALMAAVTDNLNRLFSNDVAPVRAVRDIGLGLVDRMPRLKSALIARAAGLESNGPRLLRGIPL